ncbi:MAG: hypothetical protein AABW51_00010 [Nanoarchaeota archaeon]
MNKTIWMIFWFLVGGVCFIFLEESFLVVLATSGFVIKVIYPY